MFLGCSFQTMTENSIFLGLRSRVPTAQWKTGKMAKKIPDQGNWENTGNSEILPKHREFGLLEL